MGTSLTGTKPKDTYDSLIKVGDNGPISGTAKYLSDGLGNDLPIAVSTSNVGIGTSAPAQKLDVVGRITAAGDDFHNLSVASGSAQLKLQRTATSAGAAYIGGDSDGLKVYNSSLSLTATVTETGYLRMASGTSGIQFGGDTAAANALDDYEEGTYTPTLTPTVSGSYTLSTDVRYTKIGREVYVQGLLTISSVSSPTGTAVQLSLPLAIGGTAPTGGRFSGGCITADASASYARTVRSNFGSAGNSYVVIDVDASTLDTNDEVMFGITYTV